MAGRDGRHGEQGPTVCSNNEFISYTSIHTFNISTGLLERAIDLPTMNGFIAQWLELTIDLPVMNGFIAQWLELTIDLPTMNGFTAHWLELTIDLPIMNGFIARLLDHMPWHHRGHGLEFANA